MEWKLKSVLRVYLCVCVYVEWGLVSICESNRQQSCFITMLCVLSRSSSSKQEGPKWVRASQPWDAPINRR